MITSPASTSTQSQWGKPSTRGATTPASLQAFRTRSAMDPTCVLDRPVAIIIVSAMLVLPASSMETTFSALASSRAVNTFRTRFSAKIPGWGPAERSGVRAASEATVVVSVPYSMLPDRSQTIADFSNMALICDRFQRGKGKKTRFPALVCPGRSSIARPA